MMLCKHSPQCLSREPKIPPASFPLSWADHHNFFEPRTPPNVRLLPESVSSVHAFHSLKNDHHCEDCEPGALFHTYYEMVHYPDPGPQGGTSGSQVKTYPNNQNATVIRLLTLPDENLPHWKIQRMNQKKFKCPACAEKFKTQVQMLFHMNRKHRSI